MRSYWEGVEERFLAPYGMKSKESKGRKYPEEEHFYRTAFQRDRDRVIHSSAFRRLEYKTQVFVIHEGDYYRTRLTHTLEVSQIARTIARALRLNEDLTETISLAHDIGHTPFGHAGQDALSELMKNAGGYEHNRQGLRVVDKLEKRYREFPGLNLTFEVREGIIKHSTIYDLPDYSEFEPSRSPTLEGQVVNVSDEIAYTSHDLDDGLKAELLSEEELEGIELWREIYHQCKDADLEKRRYIAIRRLIDYLVTNLIKETEKRIKEEKIKSVEEAKNRKCLVAFSPEIAKKDYALKDFLFQNFYHHYRVVRMSEKAHRVIKSLFEVYKKEPRQLPASVQKNLKEESIERVICDYIAGMTDHFALQEYKKLFDPLTLV